jgi:flagellar hook protein FlgE
MVHDLLNLGTSGMLASSYGLNVIGDNIANGQTTGFKSGRVTFQEAFYSLQGQSATGSNRIAAGHGVSPSNTSYDWSSAPSSETGVATHIALVGDGFLPVRFNGQVVYTRAGDFTLANTADGTTLMRPNGAVLLGKDGNPLVVNEFPENLVFQRDEATGQTHAFTYDNSVNPPVAYDHGAIGIVRFRNPDALEHHSGGLYVATTQALQQAQILDPGESGAALVQQGALEQSNVDLVRQFTDMIAAQRAFQANSKTITTADTLMQEILNLKR